MSVAEGCEGVRRDRRRSPPLSRSRWSLLLGPILGASCAPEAPAPAPQPAQAPGAVLAVGNVSLSAEEIEPLCADILALYPEYSRLHARRLALTNEFLPRLATRAQDPEGWQRARAACAAAVPEEPDGSAVPALTLEGNFRTLGLALWSAARHLPVGQWSAPVELTGRWVRVRLDGRDERPDPREELLRLSLLEFAYLVPEEARAAIESAIDRSRLTLVDPAFAEAVPETWKYRMHAAKP